MTTLKNRITNALNETRMLILGAQILLGFQLNAVFESGFARLGPVARRLDLAALALMSVALACLIAPAPFHRLVEGGMDTQRLHDFTTRMAEWALFPFGLCIGIDLFIVSQLLFGTALSLVIGATFTAVAGLFWYGVEAVRLKHRGGEAMAERDDPEARTSLSEKITTLMIEARVILPGAQALLGFQFIAFISNAFDELSQTAKHVHFASLACVALATILLIAPAAYHRLAARGEDRPDVERFGRRAVLCALVPLAMGLSGEFYVVSVRIGYAEVPAISAAAIALALFLGLWFGYPLSIRSLRGAPDAPGSSAKRQ